MLFLHPVKKTVRLMIPKKKRIKKGIQELNQDELQILSIYKQAYERSYEDDRILEKFAKSDPDKIDEISEG